MANNTILLDAALAGASGGNQERWLTKDQPTDYAAFMGAVVTFATAVDAAIPAIPGGATLSEASLLQSLCQGVTAHRLITSIQGQDYLSIARAIAALFQELRGNLNPNYDIGTTDQIINESDVPGLSATTALNYLLNYGSQPVMGAAPAWLDPGPARVQKVEGPVIAPSGTYTALDITGAGYVTYVFMSVRNDTDAAGRRNTRMKVYVDSDAIPGSPSIDVAMVDLGCARDMEGAANTNNVQNQFSSMFVGYMSGAFAFDGVGYYLYVTIPFNTRIRIDFVNGSSTANTILGGYIHYNLRDSLPWGRYGKMHGVSLGGLSVAPYAEQTLVNVTGKSGAIQGSYLHFSNVSTNYNYLEGNIYIYIDGEVTPTIQYDSTEDYFMAPWYAWQATNTRPLIASYYGVTRKNDSNIIGLYKWHIQDRIPFETGFRFTWFNGELASGAPVVNNTTVNGVIWYYTDS